MKRIKIILGVIIAITLVFLVTGLIVKDIKYSAEVEIDKPIGEVFRLFQDVETRKKWMPEIKSIDSIKVTPQKLGSTYKVIVDNQGENLEVIEKIKAYIPNEKVTLQFSSKAMLKTEDFNFTEQNGKTKIVQYSTLQTNSYLLACTFPWFKSKFESLAQNYLNDFKAVVEK